MTGAASPRGTTVVFTGPTGAGKSTCASAWASSPARARPTAWFDHDEARVLLRAGYVSRSAAHADPSLRDEAERQWLMAAAACEALAETYVVDGVDFALSAFRPPGEWKGCWQRLDRLDPVTIVLVPPIEVALAHDEERTGRARTGEASIRRAYGYPWDDWRGRPRTHVIDNRDLSVDDVVGIVEEVVAGSGR